MFDERDIDDPFPSLGLGKIFNLPILRCKATNAVERVQINSNEQTGVVTVIWDGWKVENRICCDICLKEEE